MNCRQYELQLEAIAAGTAPKEILHGAARHRETCASCRDLHAMARAALAAAPAGQPDLVGPVLSRTSGPVCPAAREKLCDLVDGVLDGSDRTLAQGHLEICSDCATTAATIAWMSEALPGLAEIDPGAGFVQEVVRATAGARRARAGRPAIRKGWWSSLLLRPRFTWEAAYAGALVIWLLFGAGFSPWRSVPARALELARLNPVRTLTDTVQPASLGREVWESTGGAVLRRAEASTQGWSGRGDRLRAASVSLVGHGGGLLGSVVRGDLSGGAMRLKDMGADLRLIWNELWRPEQDKDHQAQEV